MSDNKAVMLSFFEDSNEDKHFFYTSKDSVIDHAYPNNCLTNDASYRFARVVLCKYLEQLPDYPIHIHEEFKIGFFNEDTGVTSLNSSITVSLDAASLSGRAISGSINCTCSAGKVNNLGVKDTDHRVIITEEEYDDNGITKTGIGVWVDITGYKYIFIEPIISMSFGAMPIHKAHFDSWYIAEYLNNSNKINDTSLKNIEEQITDYQIGYGIYDTDLSAAKLEKINFKLDKLPDEYIQNTVYYSDSYSISESDSEETIAPYSIRGTSSEKLVSIDNVNKSFKVIKNGTYQLQLRNGFYIADGQECQLEMVVYKNSNPIKELGMKSYLIGGRKDFRSSNVVLLHLSTSDSVTLNLVWSDASVTVGHETIITINPVQYD